MQLCPLLTVERRAFVGSSRTPFCPGHSESYPALNPTVGKLVYPGS